MEQIEILSYWKKFLESYNFELKEQIWEEKSKQFRNFWYDRIMPDLGELTDEELELGMKEIIAETGATSMKDMGKVMGMATKKFAGVADGKRINEMVKKLLA